MIVIAVLRFDYHRIGRRRSVAFNSDAGSVIAGGLIIAKVVDNNIGIAGGHSFVPSTVAIAVKAVSKLAIIGIVVIVSVVVVVVVIAVHRCAQSDCGLALKLIDKFSFILIQSPFWHCWLPPQMTVWPQT